MTYTSLFLLVIFPFLLLYPFLQIGHRPKGLPPGPPTLPILGNIHLFPSRDVHLQYQKWAKEYGPIYSLILGTKTMIVLSSAEVVRDLLDRRSAIYSSRQGENVKTFVVSLLLLIDALFRALHGPGDSIRRQSTRHAALWSNLAHSAAHDP